MTGLDLGHLIEWTTLVFTVALMGVGYFLLIEGLGDLAAMRRADTPEPERRRQLNTVIQFPRKEWQ